MGLLNFIGISLIIVTSFKDSALGYQRNDHSMPDHDEMSTPEECARECVEGAKPKICYYHFTVEYFMTMSAACDLCRGNSTNFLREDCQCIMADGYEKSGIITTNRMHPGPAIEVCLYDLVVVDVLNSLRGNALTIHWHGIYQEGYQHYDGVPYVTQCPIPSGTTFRYQWKANNAGSHFWHAHTGLHEVNGLDGPIIIRPPRIDDPNLKFFDHDDFDNIMFITDWLHDTAEDHFPGNLVRRPGQIPDNFLINGKGQYTDPESGNKTKVALAEFVVKEGHRYRFRMINACAMTCPIHLSVEGHKLKVIAMDGENIKPVVVDSIVSLSAERYDFVITANQKPRNYWIQIRGLFGCKHAKVQQLAILRYSGSSEYGASSDPPSYSEGIKPGLVLNQLNVQCNGQTQPPDTICVSSLRNAEPVDVNVIKAEPDVRLYMPINFYDYPKKVAFEPGHFRRFLVAGGAETVGLIANISNVFPTSPLISQRDEIPENTFCSSSNLPERCKDEPFCDCTHIEEIPMNSVVEIVLVDEAQIPGMSHPFHLHGNAFYVIGQGCGSEFNITKIDVDIAKELDLDGKIFRHLVRPASKDTYAVPNNGFTVIRMVANNPGYWLFHCHFLYHMAAGMSLVFRVGQDSDLPPTPANFPKCGNYVPPVMHRTPEKRKNIQKAQRMLPHYGSRFWHINF